MYDGDWLMMHVTELFCQIEEAKRLEEYYASTVHTVEREDIKRDMFVTFRQFDRMKVMLTFPGIVLTFIFPPHLN